MPSYIHSDKRTSFISEDLMQFFQEKGIVMSRSTTYNSQGKAENFVENDQFSLKV